MGYTPPPPPIPDDPGAWPDWHVRGLERELRGRRSWFPWKRRRAYEACLLLILHREHVCGRRVYQPPAAEKPVERTTNYQVFDPISGGCGMMVATVPLEEERG